MAPKKRMRKMTLKQKQKQSQIVNINLARGGSRRPAAAGVAAPPARQMNVIRTYDPYIPVIGQQPMMAAPPMMAAAAPPMRAAEPMMATPMKAAPMKAAEKQIPANLRQAVGSEPIAEIKRGLSKKQAEQAAMLMLLRTKRMEAAKAASGGGSAKAVPAGEGARMSYASSPSSDWMGTPDAELIRKMDAGQMETPNAMGLPNSPPFNPVTTPFRGMAEPSNKLRVAAADFSHSLIGKDEI